MTLLLMFVRSLAIAIATVSTGIAAFVGITWIMHWVLWMFWAGWERCEVLGRLECF